MFFEKIDKIDRSGSGGWGRGKQKLTSGVREVKLLQSIQILKESLSKYDEQLYAEKCNHLNEIDKVLEKHKLPKLT